MSHMGMYQTQKPALHSSGLISHERRGDERTEANEEGAPTRDAVVGHGNIRQTRHIAIRTRLQSIGAMAGEGSRMNIRKERLKARKRFQKWLLLVRTGRMPTIPTQRTMELDWQLCMSQARKSKPKAWKEAVKK